MEISLFFNARIYKNVLRFTYDYCGQTRMYEIEMKHDEVSPATTLGDEQLGELVCFLLKSPGVVKA